MSLCGPLRARLAQHDVSASLPGRQGRLLFAYLVANRHRAVSRDELLDILWPDSPPAKAEASLRALLSKVRAAVAPAVLAGRTELRIELPNDAVVDLEEAQARIGEAGAALAREDFEAARRGAENAAAILGRGFLTGIECEWTQHERAAVDDLRIEALDVGARASVGSGALAAAERATRALVKAAPYRETGYVLLMTTLERLGNVAEAIRVYDELRCFLRDELGTAPGPEAQSLLQRLLEATEPETGEPRPPPIAATVPPRARSISRPELPAALKLSSGTPFAGRNDELRWLWDRWDRARAGEAALAFVTGDGGIGKTRLCAEFAAQVHDLGGVVLYGRCTQRKLAPYQPFVEAVARLVGPAAVERGLVGELSDLVAAMPELTAGGAKVDTAGTDPEGERYRLFDAMARALTAIAEIEPTVVIFEDVHAADGDTIAMLHFVARASQSAPLLLIATGRERELDASRPLAELIDDLRRESVLHKLGLGGLSAPALTAVIASLTSTDPDPMFVAALRERTGGNPFFVTQLVRHLLETGSLSPSRRRLAAGKSLDDLGIPSGVAEVLKERVNELGEEAAKVLGVAAVIGRSFRFDVLKLAAGVRGEDLLATLERAAAARLIEEVPHSIDHFRFPHALVRETLYAELLGARRARLHDRVARALERVHAADIESCLPDVARHAIEAAPVSDVQRALTLATRAAERSSELLAFEDAVEFYRGALRALDAATGIEMLEERRCKLLLRLGRALLDARAGEEARAVFEDAAAIGRRLGSAVVVAEAALGAGGGITRGDAGVVDDGLVRLLEEALTALGDGDVGLRAKLAARLATECYFSSRRAEIPELTATALRCARQADSDDVLAYVLDATHFAKLSPDALTERLPIADESLALSLRTGDERAAAQAHHWRIVDLLELGDVDAARAELERFAEVAERLKHPTHLWEVANSNGLFALLEGRFDEAEGFAMHALQNGHERGEAAVQSFALQVFTIRREQGRMDELLSAVEDFVERYPAIPAWRSALAGVYLELDRPGDARRQFEHLTAGGFERVPRDAMWLGTAAFTSEVCTLLGDREYAAELYLLLEPFAERNVVVGYPVVSFGAVARYLGMLAALLGDEGPARAHFEAALQLNRSMGARPWLAHTLLDYANALAAWGQRADAAPLLREARETAEELGMQRLLKRLPLMSAAGMA